MDQLQENQPSAAGGWAATGSSWCATPKPVIYRSTTIRPFVIGRKNWLFGNTPKGATASAQLYSFVETAKTSGQDPYAWLRHALERLPQASNVEDFGALLPWNRTPQISR